MLLPLWRLLLVSMGAVLGICWNILVVFVVVVVTVVVNAHNGLLNVIISKRHPNRDTKMARIISFYEGSSGVVCYG